jgi:hypothetical protein
MLGNKDIPLFMQKHLPAHRKIMLQTAVPVVWYEGSTAGETILASG